MSVDKLIKELSKKHFEKVEELTVEQFEEALLGAIKSGDFIRCVEHIMPDLHHAQGVIYVPYAQKMHLQARIKELEEALQYIAYDNQDTKNSWGPTDDINKPTVACMFYTCVAREALEDK
tara:strand:+ start:21903 stop:22262 length:360 start_codon:yes stop_codon:yes gene_type:complete